MSQLTEQEKKKKSDISYKYMPVSIFDVQKMGKKGIRGERNWGKKKSIPSSRASYSPFPPDVAEWCAMYFLREKSNIFDPFAGWGERHKAIIDASKNYTGFDISKKAIEHAKKTYNVTNILANSLTDEIPTHDGLLTCPPYWNLEKYDSKEGIDRDKTWEEFIKNYDAIFKRTCEKAEKGAMYCIMVGDWRKKNVFYDLAYQTEKIMAKYNMIPFDKVILSYKKITPIKMILPQCKRFGYTCKTHQYLLVYQKA
tara:strand:+ start:452 stop:1213 length:762 start_codon:yes stop_codon:yes gene_type:complete